MKTGVTIAALALALALTSPAFALEVVPYGGLTTDPSTLVEPNRLTNSPKGRTVYGNTSSRFNSYGMVPLAPPPPVEEERRGPGFLNADPFDPNSVVNSADRNRYANPFPYDPVYNPYGQAPSNYAPRGGANVPMGNGIPYGR